MLVQIVTNRGILGDGAEGVEAFLAICARLFLGRSYRRIKGSFYVVGSCGPCHKRTFSEELELHEHPIEARFHSVLGHLTLQVAVARAATMGMVGRDDPCTLSECALAS